MKAEEGVVVVRRLLRGYGRGCCCSLRPVLWWCLDGGTSCAAFGGRREFFERAAAAGPGTRHGHGQRRRVSFFYEIFETSNFTGTKIRKDPAAATSPPPPCRRLPAPLPPPFIAVYRRREPRLRWTNTNAGHHSSSLKQPINRMTNLAQTALQALRALPTTQTRRSSCEHIQTNSCCSHRRRAGERSELRGALSTPPWLSSPWPWPLAFA